MTDKEYEARKALIEELFAAKLQYMNPAHLRVYLRVTKDIPLYALEKGVNYCQSSDVDMPTTADLLHYCREYMPREYEKPSEPVEDPNNPWVTCPQEYRDRLEAAGLDINWTTEPGERKNGN